MASKIVVTGGSGFIGSNLIDFLLTKTDLSVLNVDSQSYAASDYSNVRHQKNPRYEFKQCDISQSSQVFEVLDSLGTIDGFLHLAAESHVDNSIAGPSEFISTNIIGTFNLLEWLRTRYLIRGLAAPRIVHVSTDEVFGDYQGEINSSGNLGFNELTSYNPSSPYSASKASSDLLVKAWFRTFGLDVLITNCSNNYGKLQHHEKLIPKVITNAINGVPIPIYGNGKQMRDWLYVDDHCSALWAVYKFGNSGESYTIGARNEIQNIDLVLKICEIMDRVRPSASLPSYSQLIEFVEDRLGHDVKYLMDPSKIEKDLGWRAETDLSDGLEKTVQWYLENYENKKRLA